MSSLANKHTGSPTNKCNATQLVALGTQARNLALHFEPHPRNPKLKPKTVKIFAGSLRSPEYYNNPSRPNFSLRQPVPPGRRSGPRARHTNDGT